MICAVCHATLPDESRFCLSCGADMSDPSAERRPVDTVADVQNLLIGAVAGHYRVDKLLGRGGMGTVFLAEDLTLQREVAIKVLPPRLTAEEKFVARFLHEARTAARLDHPNIIPIYEVQSEGSLHYFAMKYVAGRTLDQLLDGGPLPVDECRRILADASAGLGHAHRRNVVHRDVKPSNIMIDETGRVLLADFGISKALESSTQFTGTGQIVGTPHYMSPEQARGGTKLDGRSDQYALAVVGFQMLTGRLLFPSAQAHAVIYSHIHESPPTPRELRPEVPDYLDAALLKALAKEPDARFATMEEFAAAVYPERLPAQVSGPSSWPPVGGAAARRRRLGVGVVAAAVVAALAFVAYTAMHRATPSAPQPAAVTAQPAAGAAATPPAESAAASRAGAPPATVPKPKPTPATPAPAAPARSAETAKAPLQPAVRASAPAPAAVGYLTVVTEPYGTLSIDGVDVGDTPVFKRALAPGEHEVRVTRDGYQTWSQRVTITAGNTVPLHKALAGP
jgi:hypothetical protein